MYMLWGAGTFEYSQRWAKIEIVATPKYGDDIIAIRQMGHQ